MSSLPKTGWTPKPYARPTLVVAGAGERHTMAGVRPGDVVRPAGWPPEHGFYQVRSIAPVGNKLRVQWDRSNYVTMSSVTFHLPGHQVYRRV